MIIPWSSDLPLLNEAAVREEIIARLFAHLGYRPNSRFDIKRDQKLKNPKFCHPRGTRRRRGSLRPDYILDVDGEAKWVVEAKSSHKSIDERAMWQAYQYAVHPDIAAKIHMICNGVDLLIFATNGRPSDSVIYSTMVADINANEDKLFAILSPERLLETVSAPRLDLANPSVEALFSRARILRGFVDYEPWEQRGGDTFRFLRRARDIFRSFLSGGFCRRRGDGATELEALIWSGRAKARKSRADKN